MAGHSLGAIGSGLTGTLNSHFQRAQEQVSTLSERMNSHARVERTNAANYRNTEQEAADSFKSIRPNELPKISTTMSSSAPPHTNPATSHASPSTHTNPASTHTSPASTHTSPASTHTSPASANTLTGEDDLGLEHQFTPNQVHSISLTGPNHEPLGVFFPSDGGRPGPTGMTDQGIANAVNQGTQWEAHTHYRPVNAQGVEQAPQPAPWANQGTPVYAMAHGSRVDGRFKIQVTGPDGQPQRLNLDPQAYSQVLAANQHFQAATNHNPDGPLVLGSCSVSSITNGGADVAGAMHHTHGFPNTIYSPNADVVLQHDPGNGNVELGMLPARSSMGTFPGVWHTHQPPSYQPPSPQPGTPITPVSSTPSSGPPSPQPESRWYDSPPRSAWYSDSESDNSHGGS